MKNNLEHINLAKLYKIFLRNFETYCKIEVSVTMKEKDEISIYTAKQIADMAFIKTIDDYYNGQ